MSIREKSTIQIVASEAARKHYRFQKEQYENGGDHARMKPANEIRPLGEDWKHLKRELSHADISTAEESFFEEQLEREYRLLKQDDRD